MKRARGFTLIELVIAIVVLSTIGITMVGLLAFISRTSAEGLTSTQSAIIANAYLQEILSQEFSGSDDDIDGYDGRVDTGARDGAGNTISGLENYRVQIAVQHVSVLPGVPASATRLVTVTVTDPMGDTVALSGVRAER